MRVTTRRGAYTTTHEITWRHDTYIGTHRVWHAWLSPYRPVIVWQYMPPKTWRATPGLRLVENVFPSDCRGILEGNIEVRLSQDITDRKLAGPESRGWQEARGEPRLPSNSQSTSIGKPRAASASCSPFGALGARAWSPVLSSPDTPSESSPRPAAQSNDPRDVDVSF